VINVADLKTMGYFTSLDSDRDLLIAYSTWVEDKIFTKREERLVENTLGLVGEAGEVAEKVKKLIRDKSRFTKEDIIKELGDVIFYVTALANYYGSDLQEVIEKNVVKLDGREARGTLKGNGDNR
jgi:NTP pyrophosphatase (non-canonical NTP hydrolase)